MRATLGALTSLPAAPIAATTMAAIVVDLGKASKKKAKLLKKGEGPLADEVVETIAATMSKLEQRGGGKRFVPVVVMYEEPEPAGMMMWPFGAKR